MLIEATAPHKVLFANSTWHLGRDESGRKCVVFVLSQWMEGANKNDESSIRRQLESDGLRPLAEDADPFHMYQLVECEMFLRAGAASSRAPVTSNF